MSGDFSHDDMWYLNIRASNNIMTIRYFYHYLDKNQKGILRFGDDSSIKYKGKGDVHMDYTNDEHMIFETVHFIPNLKSNFVMLGKLDDQDSKTILQKRFFIIHYIQGRL